MFVDPMILTPDKPSFFNRYLLAYFYFATSEKKPWSSECAPTDTEKTTCKDVFYGESLDDIYSSKNAFVWLSNSDECKWAGVSCDNLNQIYAIRLSKCNETFQHNACPQFLLTSISPIVQPFQVM
jgi:hypothetical protein